MTTDNAQQRACMQAIVRYITPLRWCACKLAAPVSRGVHTSSFGGLRLERRPIPQPMGPDWVLCKTRLGGICGTDLSIVFLQQHPGTMMRYYLSGGVMLGHENVAEIVEAGPDVATARAGERVVVDPPLGCLVRGIDPPCSACRQGRPSVCENFDLGNMPTAIGLGYNGFTGGSWSPFFVAHRSQLHVVPDGVADEQAILVDPLACSLHAILDDLPAAGENVLVFGAGIIGLATAALLRIVEPSLRIAVTVKHPFQADLARHYGADHMISWKRDRLQSFRELASIVKARTVTLPFGMHFLQGGFDRVYYCSGAASAFADAARLVRPRGTLVLVGTPQIGITDLTPLWLHEIKVVGTTGRAVQMLPGDREAAHNYRHVLRLLQEGRIDTAPLKLAFYRQKDYRRALADLRDRRHSGVVKAAFDFR